MGEILRGYFVMSVWVAHVAHDGGRVCLQIADDRRMKRKHSLSDYSAVRIITASALSADPGDALPNRLKVLAWGDNPNANGRKVIVNDAFCTALSSTVYPFKKIPIDFEHNTVPGTLAYQESKEPRIVAGYANVECVPNEGVFLNVVRWTPEGKAAASSFEDLSACPIPDAAGHVIALPSVALCRTGAVPGIEFTQSPLSSWPALSAVLPGDGPDAGKTNEEKEMEYKKYLLGLLKLSDDATDEEIQAAIAAIKPVETPPAPAPMTAQMVADEAAKQVAPLQASLADMARQNILLAARLDGKVVSLSADALKKFTPAELQEHVKGLAVTVPLSAITPAHVDESKGAAPLSAEHEQIARNCGVDPAVAFGKREG